MGASDVSPFDNDDAPDWIADFAAAPSITEIIEALAAIPVDHEEYVEIREAANAAAAEVVAALLGRPHPMFPNDLRPWLAHQHQPIEPALIGEALRALRRVKHNSELQEVWDESDRAAAWHAELVTLQKRVSGV